MEDDDDLHLRFLCVFMDWMYRQLMSSYGLFAFQAGSNLSYSQSVIRAFRNRCAAAAIPLILIHMYCTMGLESESRRLLCFFVISAYTPNLLQNGPLAASHERGSRLLLLHQHRVSCTLSSSSSSSRAAFNRIPKVFFYLKVQTESEWWDEKDGQDDRIERVSSD